MPKMDRDTLRARLAETPGLLAGAAAAEHAGPDGEWSAIEVVRHLIGVEEEVWLTRLRQVAEESNPSWTWTEPGLGDGEGMSLDMLLALFRYRRRRTLDWLDGLDDAGWHRVGTHAIYGQLDIIGLMEIALDHDMDHLARLKRQPGPSVRPEPEP